MEAFNHFAQLAEKYDQKINRLVRATAFKIEREAKKNAPVDTGFLRNSIYTRTEDTSGDAAAFARVVKTRRGLPGEDLFPEVQQPRHNEAVVAVGAVYGIFLEYGTSKMAAQPYMTPAIEVVRPGFTYALEQVLDAAEKSGLESTDLGSDISV